MRFTFGYAKRWCEWEGGNTVTVYDNYGELSYEMVLDLPRDPDESDVRRECYAHLQAAGHAEYYDSELESSDE